MTHQEINKISQQISQSLIRHQLKDAFDALQDIINQHNLGQYLAKLEELQTTYKYMLQYAVQNIEDPERQKIYQQLLASLFALSDQIEQSLLDLYSNHMPYAYKRTHAKHHIDAAIVNFQEIREQMDMALLNKGQSLPFTIKHNYQMHLSEVFMMFWTANFYTQEHTQGIRSLLQCDSVKAYELALVTSSISLSLWRNFDVEKFNALFELTQHPIESVKQRAFVGLLIGIYLYSDRLQYFTNISSRFSLLAENKSFIKSLEQIIIQFIRSKESEKIARKFQEEIIPEMVKISPMVQEKLNLQKQDEDKDEDDKNPDWQEMLDEVPGLTDKMKEISELQMEGADVFLSTFSMLKIFPFFNTLHNWLAPFDLNYPELTDQIHSDSLRPFAESIEKSIFLCNSDKYSFLLSMDQLPEGQRATMSAAVGADFESMKDIEKSENEAFKGKSSSFVSNQYIQDIYRFFNLHPRKNEFDNLFNYPLDFHNKKIIADIIEEKQIWRNVAEYYFAKNYFIEAGELYQKLLEQDASDAECLQKCGYCAQKTHQYQRALSYYQKADLIKGNSVWTLKKMAYCQKHLGHLEEALDNYQSAAAIQPKNVSIQYAIANCYLGLNNYTEALNIYFKIELTSKNKKKAWRPIAWCSFITSKAEQAQKYYAKLLDNKATAHDYLNAGHVELANNNAKMALDLYKKAILLFDGDIKRFLDIFEEDKAYILQYGVDESDLPILLDSLRYSLEDSNL